MQHSFDINIAAQYGVNVAIFLNNVAFWIKHNQANKKHLNDGRYWTYNSSEAWAELFPYWSTDQLDRLIKKCKELGLLLTSNYNPVPYDRTRWYALTDLGLELFGLTVPRNRGESPAESREVSRGIAEPIPDINTDINTDIKNYRSTDVELDGFDDFWVEYRRRQNKQDAKKIWVKKKLHTQKDLIIQAVKKRNQTEWLNLDKRYIPNPDVFLRGEKWTDEILENSANINVQKKVSPGMNFAMKVLNDAKRRIMEEKTTMKGNAI